MKKKKLNVKSLSLNKKVISNLNEIDGGKMLWSGGCTDGCSPAHTLLNCSQQNCTADCPTDKITCNIC